MANDDTFSFSFNEPGADEQCLNVVIRGMAPGRVDDEGIAAVAHMVEELEVYIQRHPNIQSLFFDIRQMVDRHASIPRPVRETMMRLLRNEQLKKVAILGDEGGQSTTISFIIAILNTRIPVQLNWFLEEAEAREWLAAE